MDLPVQPDASVRDPLPGLLLLLTATTGLIDAICVLGLGRVFTANMTGNVVFLGFAIGGAPGFSISRCLVALAGFLAGAALGGRLGKALGTASRPRWLLAVGVIEASFLAAAAWAAIGYDMETLAPPIRLYLMISMTAVAMGLRNATVRQLEVKDLTTTVLTLTLTGLAADSTIAGGNNPRWERRLASVIFMFAGAAIGAALVYRFGLAVPLAISGGCILAATIAFVVFLGSTARPTEHP